MKTGLSLATALIFSSGVFAEDAAVTMEKSAAEAAAERQKKIALDQERAKQLREKEIVTYDGFIPDLRKSDSKKRFFSLRQPKDPANDTRNISYDERTGKARGFVLFRVRF